MLTAQLSDLTLELPLGSDSSPINSHSLDKRILNAVVLKSAASFGVLASSTITTTGLTNTNSNIGACPGSAITGLKPPGSVTSIIYASGPAACTAQTDTHNAYTAAITRTPKTALPFNKLGRKTLAPGTHTSDTVGVTLNGALTLDGRSNPQSQFVLITGTAFITSTSSRVIFDQRHAAPATSLSPSGSSATVGITSTIVGGGVGEYSRYRLAWRFC